MSRVPLVPLEELIATKQGSINPAKFPDEAFELYSIPAYDSRQPDVLEGRDIGSTKQLVEPQDVLLSKIVPHIRRSWIVGARGDCRQIASGEWIVFRSERFVPEYLRHALLCDDFHAQFMQTVSGVGGSLLRARPAHVAKIRIPLPPLHEQRRIAAILDKADALLTKRREALAQLDRLAQSIFVEMFGDPVTNPKGWPDRATLGEVADIVSGVTKGRKLDGKVTREVPYLAVANVQDMRLNLSAVKSIEATEDEIKRYALRDGDLLLTEGGDPDKLGRGTLWHAELHECIHQNHVFRVRLTSGNLTPYYLNWLVGSQRGKRYFLKSAKQTTGIASINMTQLRGFPLLVPPIGLQREFEEVIAELNRNRTRMTAAAASCDSMFASIQHRAFRGEL